MEHAVLRTVLESQPVPAAAGLPPTAENLFGKLMPIQIPFTPLPLVG
jgi:hypothetical protein